MTTLIINFTQEMYSTKDVLHKHKLRQTYILANTKGILYFGNNYDGIDLDS